MQELCQDSLLDWILTQIVRDPAAKILELHAILKQGDWMALDGQLGVVL